ncbi:hypothetical protein RCL1_004521 [Eukaryota sp. TZLM3-RCL]
MSLCRHIVSVDPERFFALYGGPRIHDAIKDRKLWCQVCEREKYLWACLERNCSFVGCEKGDILHFTQHYRQHNPSTSKLPTSITACSHSIAINLRTRVVWCYRCQTAVNCHDQFDRVCFSILHTVRTVVSNPKELETEFSPQITAQRELQFEKELKEREDKLALAAKIERKKLRTENRRLRHEELLEEKKRKKIFDLQSPFSLINDITKWIIRVTSGAVFLRIFEDKAPVRVFVYIDEDFTELLWRDPMKKVAKRRDRLDLLEINELGVGAHCPHIVELFKEMESSARSEDDVMRLRKRVCFVIRVATDDFELFIENPSIPCRNEWFLALRYALYHARKEAGVDIPMGFIPFPDDVVEVSLDSL